MQSHFQDPIPFQSAPAARLHRGDRGSGQDAHLQGAHGFLRIPGLNSSRCCRIKPLEEPVEKLASSSLHQGTQPAPQFLRAGRAIEQPHEECAKIESGAADKYR